MNEEEREIVKKFERLYLKDFNNEKITNEDRLSYIECVLMSNLIEKLQKENEELKEINNELEAVARVEKYIKSFNDNALDCVAIGTVLTLLERKDKIIDLMTNYICSKSFDDITNRLKDDDIAYWGVEGSIKQYFEKKIK